MTDNDFPPDNTTGEHSSPGSEPSSFPPADESPPQSEPPQASEDAQEPAGEIPQTQPDEPQATQTQPQTRKLYVPYNPDRRSRWERGNVGRCEANSRMKLAQGLTGEAARCGNRAEPGRRTCKFHGGTGFATGAENPAYTTGRYSQVLPGSLLRRYEIAREDPDLTALADDVALWQSRICELMERLKTGESGALWSRLREVKMEMQTARLQEPPNYVAMAEAMLRMEELVDQAGTVEETWEEITKAIREKATLATRENQRLRDMKMMLKIDQVINIVVAVMNSVRANVTDRGALVRIGADVQRLLTDERRANGVQG